MKMLQDQRVMVLGLGVSGLAMARWCVRFGAEVTVVDTRPVPPQLNVLKSEVPTARFICSVFNASLIAGATFNFLLLSPGLKPEELGPILLLAKEQGMTIGGELALFSWALASLKETQTYDPCVLAITGTNGKTTVTSLTGKLVERAGKTVAVAGNIGPSLLDTLTLRLDTHALPQVWVLELSSFQLNEAKGFEPTAGVVLNITQDHLDWHGTMQAYVHAKSFVFGSAGTMVLNREDTEVMKMLLPTSKLNQTRKFLTFGGDMPKQPGDYGLELINGMAWLVRAMKTDEKKVKRRGGAAHVEEDIYIQRLMPAEALRIRGRHNAVNALVALALAELAGCSLAPMLYGLREYLGEPHRVESIGIIKGVEYFDDSKGTNVGATVAALSGLGIDRKVVVILGGEAKGQDFSPLVTPVSQYVRTVVLIGKDKLLIAAALRDVTVPVVTADTMVDAVHVATERAHTGDAVLMSPACASFDMFDNYVHRAQVYCAAVRQVAQDVGEDVSL